MRPHPQALSHHVAPVMDKWLFETAEGLLWQRVPSHGCRQGIRLTLKRGAIVAWAGAAFIAAAGAQKKTSRACVPQEVGSLSWSRTKPAGVSSS
jgi:hypothetical protein